MPPTTASFAERLQKRIGSENWSTVADQLQRDGHAVLPGLLTPAECATIAAMYPEEQAFRSRVVMASHGFGRGEYKYFKYPLPDLIATLRERLYPSLATIANAWNLALGIDQQFPRDHRTFLAKCHAAGQTRPTPLLLRYVADDFNALHQDLYGDLYFPLQLAILLAEPGRDFEGGEFIMSDSNASGSSLHVVPLRQGDALIFAVRERPVPGVRGWRRAATRHGVSRIRSGLRHTVGVIFHDAR